MVSGSTIFAILAVGAFILAGGGALIKPAFAQAKTDFQTIRTGVTEQVKNIRAKTEAGASGESVG